MTNLEQSQTNECCEESTKENWPEWLREKYGQLPLPSLFDFILTQEKLAAEIRMQNRQIKLHYESLCKVMDGITELSDSMGCLLDASVPAAEDSEDSITQNHDTHGAKVLIEGMDILFNLFESTEQSVRQRLSQPRRAWWKIGFRRSQKQFDEWMEGYRLGISLAKEKTHSILSDHGIEIIAPSKDSSFDPRIHRALKTLTGGEPLKIAYVIRYGYKMHDRMLRCADVAVYQ